MMTKKAFLQRFKLQPFWFPWQEKKNWQLSIPYWLSIHQIVQGWLLISKFSCTVVHVLSLSQPNSTTTFACLPPLPVSFFFYLLSRTVGNTVQQNKK